MSNQDIRTLQLVRAAKNGDERAYDSILKNLEPSLKKIASRLYIVGADKDDVMQELRLGVLKAITAFNEEGGMPFDNFAINVCCKRNLKTAISHANRLKYTHHNEAVSLDAPVVLGDDEAEQTLADFFQDDSFSMLDQLLVKDEYEEIDRRVRMRLTPLEDAIYSEYSQDASYKDIAERLNIPHKCVDNALMRIRKKAFEVYQQYIEEKEEKDEF